MGATKNISPRGISIVNILLAVALFPAASLIIKDYLVLNHGRSVPDAAVAPGSGPAAPEPIESFAPVVETGVFPTGSRELVLLAAPEQARPSVDAASVLKGLKLMGTYVGARSFAIITDTASGAQEAFETGESVFDAGTVAGIREKSVEMLVGGRTVTLTLPEVEIPQAPPVNIGGRSNVSRSRPTGSATAPSGAKLKYSRKTGEREWVIDQKAVLSALDDISSVLGDARLTPVVGNKGAVEGFMVTEIKPRGIFDALGLKNGDVLRRVNGYEVNSPEKAVQVLSALKGERSIDLDVERGGSKMSFHYDIR